MYQVHCADPELGVREQIEAADTLDADPYTCLRLLLLEKGNCFASCKVPRHVSFLFRGRYALRFSSSVLF